MIEIILKSENIQNIIKKSIIRKLFKLILIVNHLILLKIALPFIYRNSYLINKKNRD